MARATAVSISIGRPPMRCFSVMPSRNSMAMNRLPVVFTDFVDRADVGMVQRGGGLRFAAGNAPGLAGLWRRRQEGISGRRSGRAKCLRLYRPHPSRRRRVSRRCGNAKSIDRSASQGWARRGHFRLRPGASQRTRTFAVCGECGGGSDAEQCHSATDHSIFLVCWARAMDGSSPAARRLRHENGV